MDFQLSDEQVLLRDTTRDLLSRSYDAGEPQQGHRHRTGLEQRGVDPAGRHRHPRTGIRSRRGGQLEVMVVLTEVGRRLAPEPVVNAALGPGAIIAEVGSDAQKELLDEVAEGQRLLAFAHLEPGACAGLTEASRRRLHSKVIRGCSAVGRTRCSPATPPTL